MQVALRRATEDDIPFIMATEGQPGYEHLVGRSVREAHVAAQAAPGQATLIGSRDGAPAGFAMLTDMDDVHGNLHVRRLAVATPGAGTGGALLDALIAWAFRETATHRLWLTAFADNARARHVYLRAGLSEEGLMRQAYRMPDGTRRDLVLMSLLRPEWDRLAGAVL